MATIELTPELLGSGIAAIVIAGAIVFRYLQASKSTSPAPVVGGILLDSSQAERLIEQVKRIADTLGDKQAAGVNEKLDQLTQQIEALKPGK